jgi:hypothetical protein
MHKWQMHPVIAPCVCVDKIRDVTFGKSFREHVEIQRKYISCMTCGRIKKKK